VVVLLDEALYGCVEAAGLRYECLIGALERIGFVKNALDQCVVKVIKDGYHCTLYVYDNILPAIIYQDNTSSIYLALKGQSDSKKTKYIAVRYFFIKNCIE
jgi:hypothetical protein